MNKLEGWGGRRFALSFATLISASILTWFGKIDGSVFQFVIVSTVAAYITGNTIQKAATTAGETVQRVKEAEAAE